jgi:hypothetical protein
MDAPFVTVCGTKMVLPMISFAMVKRVAPILDALHADTSTIEIVGHVLDALAVFLGIDADKLKEDVWYSETQALLLAWPAVLEWAGLVPPAPGEAAATGSQPSASTI